MTDKEYLKISQTQIPVAIINAYTDKNNPLIYQPTHLNRRINRTNHKWEIICGDIPSSAACWRSVGTLVTAAYNVNLRHVRRAAGCAVRPRCVLDDPADRTACSVWRSTALPGARFDRPTGVMRLLHYTTCCTQLARSELVWPTTNDVLWDHAARHRDFV